MRMRYSFVGLSLFIIFMWSLLRFSIDLTLFALYLTAVWSAAPEGNLALCTHQCSLLSTRSLFLLPFLGFHLTFGCVVVALSLVRDFIKTPLRR